MVAEEVRGMTAQVKDPVASRGSQSPVSTDESTVAELRKKVTEIANDLAKVAEARAQGAKDAAEAGTQALRRNIRRQPALAMGIAALAGAVLAITVVPRFGHRRPASRWDAWMPQMPNMPYLPQVTRADLYEMADNLQRSVSRAASNVPSSFERLVDAMTKAEPASLNAMLEKAGGWLQRVRSTATDKK
jgi:hypothetical protein